MEEKIYLDDSTLYINEETIHKGFLDDLNIDKSQIVHLCILGNVKYIEDYAFEGFNSLKEIWAYDSEEDFLVNPPSLVSIGKRAFASCISLDYIEFPYTLEYIGEDAFKGCAITELVLLTSTTKPTNYDFWYNIEFKNEYSNPIVYTPSVFYKYPSDNEGTSISLSNIPSTVKRLNSYALYGLKFDTLTISSNVEYISDKAFIGCEITLASVDSKNYIYDSRDFCNAIIESSTNTLIFGNNNSILKESVTSIGNYAFYNCKELKHIILHNNIESIGDYAFYGCYNLIKVMNNSSLPLKKGNSDYGYIAFYAKLLVEYDTVLDNKYYFKVIENKHYLVYYTGNSFVTFPEYTGNYRIGEYAFIDADITDLFFSNSVEAIEEGAFLNCKNLVRIHSISTNLKYIGHNAFYGCDNIVYINIEDIESWCNIDFKSYYSNPINSSCEVYFNSELNNVIIPDSIKELKNYTFKGSTIKNIHIPSNIEKISISAFEDCNNITAITVDNNNSIYDSRYSCNAIIHTDSDVLILGCQNTDIPISIKGIGEKAFASRILNSKDIDLSASSLLYIGNSAFSECTGLNTIEVPKELYFIGDNAFLNCTNIKFRNFKDITDNYTELKYIGVGAFSGCTGGSESFRIAFSKDLEVISNGAFKDCNFIGSRIDIPEKSNLKVIGDEAFFNTKWRDSEGVSKLHGSFENEFSNGFQNLIKIGDRAFCDSDLGGLDNSNNITIGNSAFENCSYFEGVKIPNVSWIGAKAFYNCTNLNNVLLGLNLKDIKDYTFASCTKLKYLYIPYGVMDIGDYAFNNSANSLVLNFGTHSMIPRIGKYIADNGCFIIIAKGFETLWENIWKEYDDSRLFNYYTLDRGYTNSSGILFPRYIVFNIDKYSFLAEQGMTWEKWCNSNYSKVYALPASTIMNEWSYSRIIKVDEREALNSDKAVNWPCSYTVLSVGKLNSITSSPSLISIKDSITSNGTYVITKGYTRAFIYDEDGKLEYQGGL